MTETQTGKAATEAPEVATVAADRPIPIAPQDGTPDAAARGAAPTPRPRPRGPRPLPSPLAVITVALGMFLIALTLLAIQLRQGRDPALGPAPVVSSPSKAAPAGTKASAAATATKVVTRTSPSAP